jgi:4-amino-4-deoxy-L-arabinose transferase-like glycosyltransferase
MKNLKKHFICWTAGIIFLAMLLLGISSMKKDSLTYDELAHIGAGYSYLTQQDYRMNPEHPPLIKDLAAIPLLFLHLNFPKDDPTWTGANPAVWWNQFDFGHKLLYGSGNNPDQIIFFARIPMILVMLLLGFFIFFWTRKKWGNVSAIISLFLFFSPTIIAHGRLVTTDIGAATGAVISTYFWLQFLHKPSKKSVLLAGIFFGVAMVLKFSLVLLVPFFAIITLVYAGLKENRIKNYVKYSLLAILAGLIGIIVIVWPLYAYHVANYPVQKQIQDTTDILRTTTLPKMVTNLEITLEKNLITRPLGEYVLGVLMATNRVAGGNTTYFLGQISAESWKTYFPIVYFIKNTLPFSILTVLAIITALWTIKRPWWKNAFSRKKDWVKNHFTEFAMLVFLGIYWLVSIKGNLNIGVRHLMPVFPFTIMLVATGVSSFLKNPYLKLRYILIGGLILWQVISVFMIYPHFLAYFNEAVGGPSQGYKYVVDSNLDWGQDLKRLTLWVNQNNIDKIYLDYFGGGDPAYYLGDKYQKWDGKINTPSQLPSGSYIAVSLNQLQGGKAKPAPGFDQQYGYYDWINAYTPVAKIGYSIFVYKIN